MWSVWQPERNLFFNSFFLQRPDGNVVIDPLAWTPEDAKQMEDLGGVAWIVITNRDHERRARELAPAFRAKIAAGEKDAPLLSDRVDRALRHGEEAFQGGCVTAFEGLKSPGEIAVHLPEQKAAIVGDALWGDPAGSVRMLPDDKLIDPKRAVLSLRKLWALKLDTLLVGDGACIFGDADRIIGQCLTERSDVLALRINMDELEGRQRSGGNGRYESVAYEIGNLIGARKLGYWLVTVPPGKRFCPLHAEGSAEEMFLVWEGEPTIRTLHGEYVCRRGDVIAFPTGDIGTHQLVNNSDKPCAVLMLGTEHSEDSVYYPDSDKFLVVPWRRIVRASPVLDYFDGE